MARQARWRRIIGWLIIAGLVGINAVAFMQARAMTNFVGAGARTPAIEALSLPQKAWVVLTGVSVPRPLNENTPADLGLLYETDRIDAGQGEWLEAWWIPAGGSRGVVLMFPGYATGKSVLLSSAAAVHEMGFDLLLVDFRGAGGSSGQSTTIGVREAKDVALTTKYVRSKWPGSRIVLYGESMGAVASLRAIAREQVDPDAVILESPFDRLLDTVSNRFNSMGLPAFPGAQLVVFWGSIQQGFNGFEHNPVDYATAVKCPALMLHGEQDPRVTPSQARDIYNHLTTATKTFVTFPGAGHEMLVNSDPLTWKSQVQKFLQEK